MAATVPDVTYRELQAVLDGLGSAVGAAEAHGWLCGALCARDGYRAAEWQSELIDAEAVPGLGDGAKQALGTLHMQTLEELRSQDFSFVPLLPDADTTLADRVRALAEWCGGFLYGMGAAGAGSQDAGEGDLGEILSDLGEIARARLDPQEASEADEAAFAELHEFVRAGAQLAFDELVTVRSSGSVAGASIH